MTCGSLGRSTVAKNWLVTPGVFDGLAVRAVDDGLGRGPNQPPLNDDGVLEVDAIVLAPEKSGLLRRLRLIERRRLAEEDAPLVEVEGGGGGVFKLEIEIEQIGRAGLACPG